MRKKILCFILIIATLAVSVPFGAFPVNAQTEGVTTLDDIVAASASVVRQNEGSYSSVNPNDNGALSIGWIQWHANRALNLLKDIVSMDPVKALELLGEALYNEIGSDFSWTNRILSSDESSRISALISTDNGKKAQDSLAAKDLSAYINRAMGYGITDPSALVYYADVENQCGSGGAKRVAQAAAALAGSYDKVTLDIIHSAALSDSVAGKFATRRQKTYNSCLLLDWEIVGTKYEVWDILSARNVRKDPDLSSELVTTLAAGTKVIISEKAALDSQTRGKTSMGWITLDEASCAMDTTLTGGFVGAPVTFDADGGSFGSAPAAETVADSVNSQRLADNLIIYDGDFSSLTTGTNQYGTEVAVSAEGIVLNSPTYGIRNTEIPKGGFVISGIGTAYAWMQSNLKKDNYVTFDKSTYTLSVYESHESFMGVCDGEYTANGINCLRPVDSLIIFNGDFGTNAQTNAYGTEVRVDASGKVLNNPVYGLCNSEIPEGGFVLSGIGTAYTWMRECVSKDDYVHFDPNTKKVTVYSDVNLYLYNHKTTCKESAFGILPTPAKSGYVFGGWFCKELDTAVFADTLCPSPFCVSLSALWATPDGASIEYDTDGGAFKDTAIGDVIGINILRPTDSLVIYDKGNASTTNKYGTEVRVDSEGNVLNDPVYGLCNSEIPEGGFVLSGIGTMYTWMTDNIKKDMKLTFDRAASKVTVYKTKEIYNLIKEEKTVGEPIGNLPTPEREYYGFEGWYTPAGTPVTKDTVMPGGGLRLIARWKVLPGKLSFDANGGTVDGLVATATLSGTNIQRAVDSLVLYKNKATTGTNKYGSEIIINKNGTVVAHYPYGYGNSPIPEGCYALSGIGTMHQWLSTNARVGMHVELSGNTVSLWKSSASLLASGTDTVTLGLEYGTLPTAEKKGCIFLGWLDPSGNTVTAKTKVAHLGNVTLTAKWEKLCTLSFVAAGGKVVSDTPTATAAGINIGRANNSLVIYAGKSSTGTNKYGSEAIIGCDGTVVAVYPYGRGNTPIPEDCYALSGIGTMHTWLQNSLKVGKYVDLSGLTVKVYDTKAAKDAEGSAKYVRAGTSASTLPTAQAEGKAFGGWYAGTTLFDTSTVVTSDTVLIAKWTATSMKLVFNTNGGSFTQMKGSTAVSGTNCQRPNNSLIIYGEGYGYANAQTNAYGTEVAVSADGTVLNTPVYGLCRTQIPEGGYVISAIGTGYTWMTANVKKGDYVHFDKASMTLSVYESYGDFLAKEGKTVYTGKTFGTLPTPKKEGFVFAGWQDAKGNTVTSSTTVTGCDDPVLTAIWKKLVTVSFDPNGGTFHTAEATLTGTNVQRVANALVLYKDRATTGTNPYGVEIIIDAGGKVVAIYGSGNGNAAIPEGCYALSGHGTMSTWLSQNVTRGSYVFVTDGKVRVYKDTVSKKASESAFEIYEGETISSLPTPTRAGFAFDGWYQNGNKLTESTPVSSSAVYVAHWHAV